MAIALLKVIGARLRALFGRDAVIRDMDEEMQLHIELETETNIARGMSPAAARKARSRVLAMLLISRMKLTQFQEAG